MTTGFFAKPLEAPESRATTGLALVLALFTLAWFMGLGSRALIHSDEGRYAALALAMADSGDFVTPRLNGLLYFEKPPLQYWIGALSFRWLGVTEFAARLWPALAGFLSVLTVGLTAARLWGTEAGVRAFAICASTTWIVFNSHFLTLDAGLTMFLTVTLCAVLLAECAQFDADSAAASRRRWIWVAWAAMAGAVLSKGLVGVVVPGCALLLTAVWQRDRGMWRRMHPLSGVVMLVVIAAPWFVLVSWRNPGFAEFFFVHEHFARYLTTVHQREGAWWFYLPLLLVGLLPWSSGLPWILPRRGDKASSANDTRATCILFAWSAFVLVFFSASGSKLPSYILPMFPALALLLTQQMRRAGVATLRWHLWVPTVAWLALLLASTQAGRWAGAGTPAEVIETLGSGLRAGALVFLAGALIAWWCLRRQRLTAAVLSVALGHFAATTAVMQSHDDYGQLKSAAALSKVLLPLLDARTPVFAVRSYDQTLPFYLRRNVVLVDYRDEFAFGQQREPGVSIATLDEFAALWRSLPRAAAYMSRATQQELQLRDLPMRVVFEDARRRVVIRP